MSIFTIKFILWFCVASEVACSKYSPRSLIESYGYPFEELKVVTTDGYILKIHRIPGARGSGRGSYPRMPVLLMHGFVSSSADWLVLGPENSLPFLLADSDYDVFLGNSRGNSFSREHVNMNANTDRSYWNFTWHELGVFDIPAIVDEIKRVTGSEQLHYVGHSQGAKTFLVAASVFPSQYQRLFLSTHLLAPTPYVGGATTPILLSSKHLSDYRQYIIGEFLPNLKLLAFGAGSVNLNRTAVPQILANFPAGASMGQLLHTAQGKNSGKFQPYVERDEADIPEYPIESIGNVDVYYSLNDQWMSLEDVSKLSAKLKCEGTEFHQVENPSFTHLDFLYANNVKELVYDRVLKKISES